MSSNILPKALEEALDTLSLESTLVLSNILISKAIYLRNQELRKAKVDKLLKPDTAIQLPISLHKPLENL
jgi:hypothetical protein